MALALEARLALVLRLLGRRQPARRGVRVEVDGRREGVGAVGVVVVVGVLGADGELALDDVAEFAEGSTASSIEEKKRRSP